jgi:hypothetical protein
MKLKLSEDDRRHNRRADAIRRRGRTKPLVMPRGMTFKDALEYSAILRDYRRFKGMRKSLQRRVAKYNKIARRERCAHYAPVLRIRP